MDSETRFHSRCLLTPGERPLCELAIEDLR